MESSHFTSSVDVILSSVEAATVAFDAGHVPVSVRDHVAEYGVIEAASLFEQFLGDLFVDCLLGRTTVTESLVLLSSERDADLVLFRSDQPEQFLSWLPYDTTVSRAKRLLKDGEPFARIHRRSADIAILKDLSIVRNFAAHGSESSQQKFEALCLRRGYVGASRASDYVLKREQGSTQLELMLTRLKLIASALTDPDEARVLQTLGPEDPWSAGKAAPRGTYRCESCATQQQLSEPGNLERCRQCRPVSCTACGRRSQANDRWLRIAAD